MPATSNINSGDDTTTTSDSAYGSVAVIHQCGAWHNFLEKLSDIQHEGLPPIMNRSQGYNYHISIAEDIWDRQLNPLNITRTFDANDISFIAPTGYRNLLLSTG